MVGQSAPRPGDFVVNVHDRRTTLIVARVDGPKVTAIEPISRRPRVLDVANVEITKRPPEAERA